MPDSLWLHGLEYTSLSCPSLSPRFCSNSCQLSQWFQTTISSSVAPSPPAFNLSQHDAGSFPVSWLFLSGGQSIDTSASVSAFQRIFRVDFLQDWLVWSPCRPWDSQECSPVMQFKTINSLTFSLINGLTLTSVRDYWKNHSFDYMELCWQSDVSAF